MYNLIQLGWNEFFESQFQSLKDKTLIPARVAVSEIVLTKIKKGVQ